MQIPISGDGIICRRYRTVGYVEYDHGMGLPVGQLADTPLPPAARGVLASVFIVKRVTDTIGIVHERSDDEFSDRHGDSLGKARELALRTPTSVKSPTAASIGHAAPVRRNR